MSDTTSAQHAVGERGGQYAIGIDLGTTHCALAWVDLSASEGESTVHGMLDIPQLTAN